MSDSEDISDEDFAPGDVSSVPRPAKRAKAEDMGTGTARARPVWPPPPSASVGPSTLANDNSSGGGSICNSISSSSSNNVSSGGDSLGPQVMHGGESLTQPEFELVKFYEKLASREDAQRRARQAPLAAAAAAAAAVEGGGGSTVGPGGHIRKPVAPPPPASDMAAPSSAAAAAAAAVPAEPRGPSMLDRITEASKSSSSTGAAGGNGSISNGVIGASASAAPAPGTLKKKKVLRPPGAPGTADAPARAAVARSWFDRGEVHAELPAEFTCWTGEWVGELADDALDVELPHFAEPADGGPASSRCVAVLTCTIPADSAQFAVNVCPVPHGDGDDVWLHFNPRQFERGGSLVVDYKVVVKNPSLPLPH